MTIPYSFLNLDSCFNPLHFSFAALRAQLDTLYLAIEAVTDFVNARGETMAERLQDVPVRIQEVTLHGVRSGAANALAAAQLSEGLELVDSLVPSFIDECADPAFADLVDEFAPCADAVAAASSVEEIVNNAFFD
jgi:hypothetical protein